MLKILAAVALLTGVASADSKPRLEIEKPTITGKLDAKLVTSALERSRKKIVGCFAKETAATKATFTVGADGKLSNIALETALSKSGQDCIVAVFSKLQLPKRKDAATVTVDLRFSVTRDSGEVTTLTVGDLPSGAGSGSGMKPGSNVPMLGIGQPTAKGELDVAIIRRYIKRSIQKLQYCYEKQLLVNKTLKGTVTADFAIGADGKVTVSDATGVDKTVSGCIADVIRAIEFPKPKQGTVTVRLPFELVPAPPPAKAP